MPAEPTIPEGSLRIELGPVTEVELRGPGAVKLLYGELTELKSSHSILLADLQGERQRNEALAFRAHSSETDCSVLRERLGYTGHRDIIVRLIEIVILGLLAFAIDFSRSKSWGGLSAVLLMSIILLIAIFIIQRGHRPKEKK